jgi:hypothetical protein
VFLAASVLTLLFSVWPGGLVAAAAAAIKTIAH